MEVCLESSGWAGASPRISFSHDLPPANTSESSAVGNHRLDASLPLHVSSSSDFNFSLGADVFSNDPSLADDLFSDGKLLPLPIKNPPPSSSSLRSSAPEAVSPAGPEETSTCHRRKHDSLREIMASSDGGGIGRSSPQKPFWRFRRSSSLNCGGGGSKSSLCPFPLLRSHSSGSSPMQRSNAKQYCSTSDDYTTTARISKGNNDASSNPFTELPRKSANESKTKIYYYSGNSRRPCQNAVRISPILNVPTPRSVSIFSYLLCKRGDKSMGKSSAVTCYP